MGSEIIFIIPAVLGFAAVATFAGTFLVWLVWRLAHRRRPLSRKPKPSRFPLGTTVAVLLAISLPVGCIVASQPVAQPESLRTVAAFEVPITSAEDRADFLAIVRSEAREQGLEVDAETPAEMERWTEMSPDLRLSIHATAYRGGDRRQAEAEVSDRYHLGHVWISFAQGEDPALARRFRDRVMSRIVERWPETLSVPVAETGTLPHREDLIPGEGGYEIDPAKLAGYICGSAPGNAPHSACE